MSRVGLDLAKEIRWVKLMCQLLISRENMIFFKNCDPFVKYTTHLGVYL